MRAGRSEDYYALLRVARTATAAELRRSYRLLALRYHPDRAGPGSTETFQRIARAYAVLSNAVSRSAYDRSGDSGATPAASRSSGENGRYRNGRSEPDPRHPGAPPPWGEGGWEGRVSWRVGQRATPIANLLPRLSGSLEDLLARDIASRCDDGVIELWLTGAEATAGGTAVVDVSLPVACPTCGGIAQRYVLWCRRCEYAGTIVDQIAFRFEIPARVSDRTMFTFTGDAAGISSPLRLRLRTRP